MAKENMFENALTLLPWSSQEDFDLLITSGAKVKKEKAKVLLRRALQLNDAALVGHVLKSVGGVTTLREMDSVETPGQNEYDLLEVAMDEHVGLDCLKTLVEHGFNVSAGSSPFIHRNDRYGTGHFGAKNPYLSNHEMASSFDCAKSFVPKSVDKLTYLVSKGWKYYSYKGAVHFKKDLTGKEDTEFLEALAKGREGPEIINTYTDADGRYSFEKVKTAVWRCIDKTDVEGLKELLKKGAPPHFMADCNDADYSPVAEAYYQDKPEIAKVLIQAGGMAQLDGRVFTIQELLDGKGFTFTRDKDKWKEVCQLDKRLFEKFPHRGMCEDMKKTAKARKSAMLEILGHRAAGKKDEALKTAKKFHEANPDQLTALTFTRLKKEKT